MQLISFEEYVKALDHDSAIPKGKLVDILNAREANQNNQMQNIPPGMIPGMSPNINMAQNVNPNNLMDSKDINVS